MKTTTYMLLLVLLGLAMPAEAASKWKKVWKASLGLLVTVNVLDVHSSWNQVEANGLLVSQNGRFGAKGLTIKTGLLAGAITSEWLGVQGFHRTKYDRKVGYIVGSIVNLSMVGVYSRTVYGNYTSPYRR